MTFADVLDALRERITSIVPGHSAEQRYRYAETQTPAGMWRVFRIGAEDARTTNLSATFNRRNVEQLFSVDVFYLLPEGDKLLKLTRGDAAELRSTLDAPATCVDEITFAQVLTVEHLESDQQTAITLRARYAEG